MPSYTPQNSFGVPTRTAGQASKSFSQSISLCLTSSASNAKRQSASNAKPPIISSRLAINTNKRLAEKSF